MGQMRTRSSEREHLCRTIRRLSNRDLDRVRDYIVQISSRTEPSLAVASETSLSKGWDSPEEDIAWAHL
jgi:hypothetical protein